MDGIDGVFRVFAHPVRRELLCKIKNDSEDVVGLDDLSERLIHRGSGERGESLKLELHHRHLPVLQRAGIVDYDRRSGIVRYRESPPLFDALCTVVRDHLEGTQ